MSEPDLIRQAKITSFPNTLEVQVVRWVSYGGAPQKRTYRSRTMALKKAARLEAVDIAAQVYCAEVGPWRRLDVRPAPEHV